MRKLIVALCFLVYSVASFSQDTLITYYDSSWKPATPGNYTYSRKKIKTADGWKTEDFFHSGKIAMTGSFSDEPGKVRNGDFTWFLENGDTMRITHFTNGKRDGINKVFYPSGKLDRQGFFKMGKYDGDWIGYFESGKISGTAHYEDDVQKNAEMYNEDGSINKDITFFESDPSFPVKEGQSLSRFLGKNMRYPEEALTSHIQGKVILSFIVEKDGTLSDIKIAEAANESLNNEALRVVRSMPKWVPAIRGGRIVREPIRLPLAFQIGN